MRVDLTQHELELTIAAVLDARAGGEYHPDDLMVFRDLHTKLEQSLEVFLKGGEVELYVSEEFKSLGVARHYAVIQPHGEEYIGEKEATDSGPAGGSVHDAHTQGPQRTLWD